MPEPKSFLATYKGTVNCEGNSRGFTSQQYRLLGEDCNGRTLKVIAKIRRDEQANESIELSVAGRVLATYAKLSDRFLEISQGSSKRYPVDEKSVPLAFGVSITEPASTLFMRRPSDYDRKVLVAKPNASFAVSVMRGTPFILESVNQSGFQVEHNDGVLFTIQNSDFKHGLPGTIKTIEREPLPLQLGGGTSNGKPTSAESHFELVSVQPFTGKLTEASLTKGVKSALTFRGNVGYGAVAPVETDPWAHYDRQDKLWSRLEASKPENQTGAILGTAVTVISVVIIALAIIKWRKRHR